MKYEIFLNTAFHYGSDNAETIINKYFDSKKKYPKFKWEIKEGEEK